MKEGARSRLLPLQVGQSSLGIAVGGHLGLHVGINLPELLQDGVHQIPDRVLGGELGLVPLKALEELGNGSWGNKGNERDGGRGGVRSERYQS